MWQYKVIYASKGSELEIELNRLGKEGWEAVSMGRSDFAGSYTALLKRAWDDVIKQWVR